MSFRWQPRLGAVLLPSNRCRFRVWAPLAERVSVHLVEPEVKLLSLEPEPGGYFSAEFDDIAEGTLYFYQLSEDKKRPDPVSRSQPRGVHGPSEVIDRNLPWTDDHWHGLPLANYVLYELHPGAFTPEGTFEAIIPRLEDLKSLGVTALSLLPVAQNPGDRNWGYDGVYLHAVQHSYDGPKGLARLVDAAHAEGLAVVLDVVYNHLGPEGNYLWDYGPYFTDGYKTPWGPAVNFDGPHSDEVRAFFLENALSWMLDYHIDGLRLDAVHAIKDFSAYSFLEELGDITRAHAERVNRRFYLIAESDLNDTRIIRDQNLGGMGLDSQWSDSLHHAAHCLLTGEARGYYSDYGEVDHLVRALRTGYTYEGQHSPFRNRRYGSSAANEPPEKFVVYMQNHDQVGNRMEGDRLGALVSPDELRLAAATVILSPYIPMLFMGEEYGDPAPFPFFTSHGDPGLIEAVREGRRREFESFEWKGTPPDPQSPETFLSAKLNWELRDQPGHRELLEFHKELLRLRREIPLLSRPTREGTRVDGSEIRKCVTWTRTDADEILWCVLNYNEADIFVEEELPRGIWEKLLDTSDPRWGGNAGAHPPTITNDDSLRLEVAPRTCVLYRRKANTR